MCAMSPDAQKVKSLMLALVKTGSIELNCDEAQELFDHYVELDLSSEPIPEELRLLQDHLEWCGCCQEVVAAIKAAVAGLDEEA